MTMDEPKKNPESKAVRKPPAPVSEPADPGTEGVSAVTGDEVSVTATQDAAALTPAQQKHLRSHLNEAALANSIFQADEPMPYQAVNIVLQNVRANSKVFVTIRDDQTAVWSEGDGKGLVGLSFSTTRDQALYLSNFLINAREFFLQTYSDCQEILVQLYVRTAQHDLRGRVDLPPGAIATLQSRTDRTSVVGLSAFAIDF